MSEPTTPSSPGPWPAAVATEDLAGWSHWVCRPCGTCGHAFIDHDNNAFENTEDCRHCDCRSFTEPASTQRTTQPPAA